MQIAIRNRQRSRTVNLPLLRRITKALLTQHTRMTNADLCILLVGATEMTRLNENFLQHAGSTDVITFDYSEPAPGRAAKKTGLSLHGELFICVDESIIQARKFRTSWQSEIVRYLIHGVLHLVGHDDTRALARKKMKTVENKLLVLLEKEFDLRRLDKTRRAPKVNL